VSLQFKSILLVDDDNDDQLLFQEALEEVADVVHCFISCNGIDALEKLNSAETSLPDLIIMDVNMPIVNGIECLRAIKKSETLKAIPVIMYSTSCSQECEDDCLNSGAAGYMEKPSCYLLLCKQIKHILEFGYPANPKTLAHI
jgi:CheY-like chemotaxis protein